MISMRNRLTKFIVALGILICGLYSIISSLFVDQTGLLGRSYYKFILDPLFGNSAWMFGLFLIFIAFIIALIRTPGRAIIGLIFVLSVALIANDDSFSFGTTFSQYNIGRNLKVTGMQYIGPYGVLIIQSILLLLATILFYTYRNGFKVDLKTKSQDRVSTSAIKPVIEDDLKEKEDTIDSMETNSPAISLKFDQKFNQYSRPKLKNLSKFNPTTLAGTCKNQSKIVKAFASFKVSLKIGKGIYGPFSERYEIILEFGAKRKDVDQLVREGDLSIALGIKNLRISEDAEAKLYLEIPHQKKPLIQFNSLLTEFSEYASKQKLQIPMLFGVDSNFKTVVEDLAALPHLLIAGTTGSGKSVLVKSIITSLMYGSSPNNTKLILVDPKFVEFSIFEKSPFLACEVITSVEASSSMIVKLIEEMEDRYRLLKSKSVHSLKDYNDQVETNESLSSVVLIIDEFADLMMMKKSNISDCIIRIAQKGRAAGIHLILATQRPSVNVINGLIKANVPGRAALKVASDIDSRTILDKTGADKLTGHGHMILITDREREVQSAFISDQEIKDIAAPL
jgi:DNA segregation ATPase FtsK/SpoIIIE, S-DNA-T family